MYKLNRLAESWRPLIFNKHFDPWREKQCDDVLVMRAQHISVSAAFYRLAGFHFPLVWHTKIIGTGKTFIIRQSSLTELATGQNMVSIKHNIVNMSLSTGKSHDLPQIRGGQGDPSCPDSKEVFPFVHIQKPPLKHFSSDAEVRPSDLDLLFHTKQACYIQYSLDCAAKAAKENFFTQIKNDVCFYRMEGQPASSVHMAESFAGDSLRVRTWEDPHNPMALHFTITKGDRDVYYTLIEFYE